MIPQLNLFFAGLEVLMAIALLVVAFRTRPNPAVRCLSVFVAIMSAQSGSIGIFFWLQGEDKATYALGSIPLMVLMMTTCALSSAHNSKNRKGFGL